MAKQKFKMSTMARHEMNESPMYEKAEEKAVRGHFSHGGDMPENRRQHFTVGKHAIDHREDTELYAPGK